MKKTSFILKIIFIFCFAFLFNVKPAIAAEPLVYDIKAAENEKFILYIKENGGFAVKNKQTGFLYTSNPVEAPNDTLAVAVNKTNLLSQFYITYSNAVGRLEVDNTGLTSIKDVGIVTTVNSQVGCVSRNGLTYELIENGVIFNYYFDQQEIMIPLRCTLFEDYLLVEIVIGDMYEGENYKLLGVTLLPYFCAGGSEDDGYIFIPDGSGALMNFNNEKARYGTFSKTVYDRDYGLTVEKLSNYTESVAMPVFGIKNGSNGFLGIIENGKSLASINALTSGTITSYNVVYPEFKYRETAIYTLKDGNVYASNGTGGDSVNTLLYAPNLPQGETFSVRYYMLDAPDMNYSHMAETYRNYLINEAGMTKKVSPDDAPLYVSLLGGLYTEKYFLGFNYNTVIALTSFNEAEKLLRQLVNGGVENIVVKYENIFKGGLGCKIPSKVELEKNLGSKKDYENLLAYARDNGIQIFPDVDIVNLYKSGNGFSKYRNSVQDIGDSPTYRYKYDLNYSGKYKWSRWYLLTPLKVASAFNSVLNNYGKLKVQNISLTSLGRILYSDFTTGSLGINRADAQTIWEDIFNTAQNDIGKVMATYSFDYTFPYVDYIMEAPVSSSKYDLSDEEVPFYQMVLHGYISLSVPSINHADDIQKRFLKAIETGSSLSFIWMENDNNLLLYTNYDNYFSANYELWLQTAIDYYNESKDFLKNVSDATIINHQKLQNDVYRTDFSNGISVIVNYGKSSVKINGLTVSPKNYLVIGG